MTGSKLITCRFLRARNAIFKLGNIPFHFSARVRSSFLLDNINPCFFGPLRASSGLDTKIDQKKYLFPRLKTYICELHVSSPCEFLVTVRVSWLTVTVDSQSNSLTMKVRQAFRQINRQSVRQTDKQTDKQTDRQTDKQTDRQTDRQR